MFSSKISNDKIHLNTTLSGLDDTYNGTPKMTSTPLHSSRYPATPRRGSAVLTPTKPNLSAHRRYSLSEVNYPMNKQTLGTKTTYSPGPLLASLNYRDNISMYEETKSTGLAGRVVLYNEEAEQEKKPTHQDKYGSPGLFPIVHLFKKKPPFLEQLPKRVKIKLSSPDFIKHHSPAQYSKLREGITTPRFLHQHSLSLSQTSDAGTKSVLDALKEISRKRIHSNEEYESNEDSGKRIRTEQHNGSTTTKRIRDNSPLLDSSQSPSPKPTLKKICVYDEYAASRSSTDFSFSKKADLGRSKRKTISTSTESLKEPKHVKLVTVETQTTLTADDLDKSTGVDESVCDETDSQKLRKKGSPLKVFDDERLDRIRRNRLAALMGTLAGKDAILPAKPSIGQNLGASCTEVDKKREEEKTEPIKVNGPTAPVEKETIPGKILEDKPLVSILSPSKTPPAKSDKHVHFGTPATNTSEIFGSSFTQTSESLATPIVSASITKSPSNSIEKNNSFTFVTPTSKDLKLKPSMTASLGPKISLGDSSNNQSSGPSSIVKSNTIFTPSSSNTTPSFSFPTSLETSKQFPDSPKLSFEDKKASPPKMGGFKFDLKTTKSDVSSATSNPTKAPTFSFIKSPIVNNSSSTTPTTASTSVTPSASTFLCVKPTELKNNPSFSFGATTSTSSIVTTSAPSFGFATSVSKSAPFNFGNVTCTSAPSTSLDSKLITLNPSTSSGFNFANTAGSKTFGSMESNSSTQIPTALTFGTTTASSNMFNLPSSNPTFNTIPKAGSFGAGTTPSFANPILSTGSSFGNNITQVGTSTAAPSFTFSSNTAVTNSVFGSAPSSTFGVKSTSTTMPSVFGTKDNSTFGFGSTPLSLDSVFTTTATTALAFGNAPATTAPAFGTSANAASVFGKPPLTSVSGFGGTPVTTTSNFGNTTSTNNVFGSAPTTTSSVFGSSDTKPSAFGSPNIFGNSTTQPAPFGGASTTTFGNASAVKPLLVPASTTVSSMTPNFGSTITSGFGSTTTATPIFGSSTTPSFSFGSKTTAVTSSSFGSNTFSGASSGFGTNTNAGFGANSASSFGALTTSSNTFASPSAPAFGHSGEALGTKSNAFAFGGVPRNKGGGVFGSGSGNSAFGKPANTQSTFNSTSGFETTSSNTFNSQPAQQSNGGFNFGSGTASTAPSGAFAFGPGSSETPKPTFNFTAGASNLPAFGATTAPPFGAPALNFGAATPNFNNSTGTPGGVFNIGTGSSSSGRPRTQLRAKRRT